MAAAARWTALIGTVLLVYVLLAWVGAPSPPLFGGLLAAMLVTLASTRPPLHLPHAWFRAAQAVIGVTVAALVDWSALASSGSDLPVIGAVIVGTIVTSVLSGLLLCLHGVSTVTASFASIAGGASGMISLAHDLGADDRVVMIVQYRVCCSSC